MDSGAESRRRPSSAVQDFRELARWFAAATGEEDLHRLWSAAFGLGPARHAHLAHPDPELIPSSHSWSEAPPVQVSALLRTSGRAERFTRTVTVRNAAGVRGERAEPARAWPALETDGPVRLCSFSTLDPAAFERLLDLLGRAPATRPNAGGRRRATTGDGRVEVALSPPPGGRAGCRHRPDAVAVDAGVAGEGRSSGGADPMRWCSA